MQKVKFWWPTFLGAIAFLVGALLNLPIFNLTTALFLVVGLFVIQIILQQREIEKLKNVRPDVRAIGFDIENVETTIRSIKANTSTDSYPWLNHVVLDKDIVSSSTDSYITTSKKLSEIQAETEVRKGDGFERFYAVFRNENTETFNTQDAIDIHARIEFYDEKGIVQIVHEKPRWRNKPTPDKIQEKIIISASGKPEQLCLVIRKKKQKKLYVFSDNSYSQETFDPQKKEFLLKGNEHNVHIVLSASNMAAKSYWFSLVNNGGQQSLTFDIIEKPSDIILKTSV